MENSEALIASSTELMLELPPILRVLEHEQIRPFLRDLDDGDEDLMSVRSTLARRSTRGVLHVEVAMGEKFVGEEGR